MKSRNKQSTDVAQNDRRFYCWGTPVYSSWELSDALTRLNVSHTIRVSRTAPPAEVELGFAQPRPVHVTDRVTDMREGSVNFISASYADLSHTNVPKFPEAGQYELELALKLMLESSHPPVRLVLECPTALEYVAMLSKPSLLNHIQTLVYKIQPYSLRKETQALILRFFTGQISRTAMLFFLKRSLKTSDLIPLIEEGEALRTAVLRCKTESVDLVARDTGIASFDLVYLGKERIAKSPKKKPNQPKESKSMPNSMRQAIAASGGGKVVKF